MSNVFREDLDNSAMVDEPRRPLTPPFSASTPVIRRFTIPFAVPFDSSPLSNSFEGKNTLATRKGTDEPFRLTNLSLSLANESSLNECSFNNTSPTQKLPKSLNKDLFRNTPPVAQDFGLSDTFQDDFENLQPLDASEDELEQEEEEDEEKENPNKRGLSDSYLKQIEMCESVPQLKRPSSEHLPVVPGCMDSSYDNPPLIGNNSRQYLLPYKACHSEHCDLKCISPSTMNNLVKGVYSGTVENYVVIDTRYPYEFDGGHIEGAFNVVTQNDLIQQFLTDPLIPYKRQVIIFHCEFSSKRGPRMCRFLRKEDRDRNVYRYPELFYPEMYILHGGYKEFFPLYPDLCTPSNYIPMADPNYEEQLMHWQKVCKTITDPNGTTNIRGFKSRLRSQRQLQLS